MSRPAGIVRALVWAALAASMATATAAETYSIGTLGATIPAGNWERRTLVDDLGSDQFLRADTNYFMLVYETFDLYEQRTDFLESLDLFLSGIEGRMNDVTVDPEVGYSRLDDYTRATRRVSGSAAGLQLAYQLDLISAGDGVGYLVMSWSTQSGFEGLKEAVDETLAGLELPGPDSEWAERTRPSSHAFDFGDWTIELTYRDSAFTEGESVPGKRHSLSASAGDVGIHLFLDELSGDADDVLDQVRQVASDEEYEELTRSDVELELGPARQLLMRSTGDQPIDMALAVIGLGDDRWVDLRMVSSERTGHRPELWDGLLRSIRVIGPDDVDAFPVVAAPPAVEPGYLGPAARRLLEASRRLAAPNAEVVAVRPDGKVLVREGRRLTLLSPSETEDSEEAQTPSTEVLYQRDDYLAGTVVPWGERTLLIDGDGEVWRVTGGNREPAGFDADLAAVAGDALLVARNGRRESLLGLADLPAVGSAEVHLRDAAGEERLLLERPEERVTALAYRPTGEALIATVPQTSLSTSAVAPATRLLRVGVGGGEPVEVGRWERVDRLEPAPGGWLVTGIPPDGRRGVYRLDDGGRSELLLSGDAVGLGLNDGEITFATSRCLDPSDDYYRRCVYRADLDLTRQLGSAFQPFSTRVLNRIGARVGPDLEAGLAGSFPPTREAIADYVASADRAARELAGADLPLEGGGVDDLLETLSYDRDLSDHGVLLLTALLTESLLRDGAVWEAAGAVGPPPRGTSSWECDNPFAVGLHPLTVVLGALYEEEGWYRPASSIVERASGRTIVLGLDPDALRERVAAEEVPELPDLLRAARVARLTALLEARPGNVFLRETVYKHLAAHGHHAEVAEVASAFAARDDAEGIDAVAWMAGRLAGDLSPDGIAELVSDLRSAIEREPGEAALYMLLGSAYERSSEPDRLALAGACYREVRERAPWGTLGSDAEQALERLAEAE